MRIATKVLFVALVAGVALGVVLLVPACGNERVTKSNYDRIDTCMSYDDVVAILGPPDQAESEGSHFLGLGWTKATNAWSSGSRTITLTFVEGRVVAKAHSGL